MNVLMDERGRKGKERKRWRESGSVCMTGSTVVSVRLFAYCRLFSDSYCEKEGDVVP